MVTVKVNGTPRNEFGKKATSDVRRAGLVPCVLYGPHKDNVHFTVKPHDVRDLVYTGDFKLAELDIDGKTHRCIVKDVDFDPVKDTIQHMDFLLLDDGQTVKVEVPLRFTGTSPGVRNGGKFIQSVRKVKIKTRVETLVDELFADISGLKLGESLRIRDINAVDGVEIMNPGALPVASVVVPRSLKSAGLPEDEEGEGGETEGEGGEAAGGEE